MLIINNKHCLIIRKILNNCLNNQFMLKKEINVVIMQQCKNLVNSTNFSNFFNLMYRM